MELKQNFQNLDFKVESIECLASVMQWRREIIQCVTERVASTRVSCIEKSTVMGKFYKTIVRPASNYIPTKVLVLNEEEKISNESCIDVNAKMDLMWRRIELRMDV